MPSPDPVDHAIDVLRAAIAIVSEDVGALAVMRPRNGAASARIDTRVVESAAAMAALAQASAILRRMKNRF